MIKTLSKPWPWNAIPDATPADWGLGMTVCVAGCSNNDAVVCVTDMMVAMTDLSMSADAVALKMKTIGERWVCMQAGDVAAWPDVLGRAREEADKRGLDWHKLSRSALTDVFRVAFHEVAIERAEARILAPFDLNRHNYRDEGPKLGQEMYTRLLISLEESKLGLKLLIAGFGGKSAHVLSISDDGISDHYSSVGVWAIGSGETAALGYLFSHQINFLKDLPSMLYALCCAKFSAETSPGVGKKTVGVILYANGDRCLFVDPNIEWIRNDWERARKIGLPKKKHEKVEGILAEIVITPHKPEQEPKPPSTAQTSEGQQ